MPVVGPGSGSKLISVEFRHTGGALGRASEGCGPLAALPGTFIGFDAAPVERLRAAKRRYDPGNIFHASHAIGA